MEVSKTVNIDINIRSEDFVCVLHL